MSCWSRTRSDAAVVAHGRRRVGRHLRANGQSVAEFALVLPVLVAILGGIIQFGLVFWAQNTLTQVVRDTGRWAATQQYGGSQRSTNSCATTANANGVAAEANAVAASSSLLGYTGQWTVGTQYTPGSTPSIGSFAAGEGVAVMWADATPSALTTDACPPPDNTQVWFVTIKINHTVPTFFPGMQYLPGLGTNGQLTLSSTATFRMEPAP